MNAELLLIRNEPSCRRCHDVQALLEELAAARPGRVTVRCVPRNDPEAARYGAVLTPMVVLNGKVVCAGVLPFRSELETLLDRELGGLQPDA